MREPDYFTGPEEEPTISGVAAAKVTDNKDPEGLGRVKVTYPFREVEDESTWARVATEMASKEYGTWFLPEVGDEVLVAFEDGRLSHPYVIGSLYNGKRPPPHDNGDGKNTKRGVTSRSEHAITIDDSKTAGKITIETSAGHTITLDDSTGGEKVTVEDKSGNSIELNSVSNEISISANKKISLDAQTIELSGKKVDISADSKASMEGKAGVDVKSSANVNVKSNGLMGVKASGPLTIKGAIIQLN